jgi:hypothetical protein
VRLQTEKKGKDPRKVPLIAIFNERTGE